MNLPNSNNENADENIGDIDHFEQATITNGDGDRSTCPLLLLLLFNMLSLNLTTWSMGYPELVEPEHVEVVHVNIAASEPDSDNENSGEIDHPFWTGEAFNDSCTSEPTFDGDDDDLDDNPDPEPELTLLAFEVFDDDFWDPGHNSNKLMSISMTSMALMALMASIYHFIFTYNWFGFCKKKNKFF